MYRHLALDFCLEDSIDAPRNNESFTTIVLRIPITATQYSGSRRRSLLAVTKSSAAVLHRPEPENKQLPSTVPSYLPTPRQTHFLLAHRQHDRAWFDTSPLLLPRIKALYLHESICNPWFAVCEWAVGPLPITTKQSPPKPRPIAPRYQPTLHPAEHII